MIKESKLLLNALGVPIIDSPSSAESQCADLVKNSIADYFKSQEFDSVLFGYPRLIQNLSKSLKRKENGKWTYLKIDPLSINLKKTLKLLDINQFQLVDLAILLKTDYFKGVKGIGPKTALKLIKKYLNLENVIFQERDNYDFSELNLELIMKIGKLFLLPSIFGIFGRYSDIEKVYYDSRMVHLEWLSCNPEP